MRKASIIILLLATTLFGFTGLQEPIVELVLKIENYFDKRPMEKVFLHLDKPFYTLGDRVWFKAYTLNYQTNFPSKLSETLNVIITDQENRLLQNVKVILNDGLGNGYLEIPNFEGLNQVQISAYTNWMRNFDESIYFKKVINIGGSTNNTGFSETDFKVTLFPEGGTILNQKLSKIGFRSSIPTIITGHVIKNDSDTITSIASDSLGYGAFSLIPNADDSYKVIFKQENKHTEINLPTIREKGTTLRVDKKGDYINIIAECSPEQNDQDALILIQNNGQLLYSIKGTFVNNGILTRLKSDELNNGLISISLFNTKGDLLNERLFYNIMDKRENLSKLSITGPSSSETNANVTFDVNWNQSNVAFTSVSVTPNKYFSNELNASIKDYTELINGTDIKQLRPSFSHDINDKLITHNIKSFEWESILSDAEPEFKHRIEKKGLFEIRGNANQKIKEGDVYGITLYNEHQDFYFDRFKDNGNFSFTISSFTGSRKLIIKALGKDKDLSKLDYEIDFHTPSSIISEGINTFPDITSDYVRDSKENMAIDRIYGIARTSEGHKEKSDEQISFSILKSPDNSMRLEDYVPLPSMEEIARELLEGVRISVNKNGEAEIRMRSINEESGYFMDFNKEQPLLFIDGLLINDPNTIALMNPLNIESIDMSYGQYTLNGVSFKGILALHTVEKNYAELNEGAHGIFTITGFQEPKKYVTPNLDVNTPDFRTLLYWNPNLILHPNKGAKISFRTSDETGSYTINIQGVTEAGELISKSYDFEVTSSYK